MYLYFDLFSISIYVTHTLYLYRYVNLYISISNDVFNSLPISICPSLVVSMSASHVVARGLSPKPGHNKDHR